MDIHIHVHIHEGELSPDTIHLRNVLSGLNTLSKQGASEMKQLDDLKAAVEAQKTVDGSVTTLLTQLKTKLDELAARETVDPAELQALSDSLATEQQSIADAVVANTPAA